MWYKVNKIRVGTQQVRPVNFATQWPCPDGFHVPLQSEIKSLINAGISLGAWVSDNWNWVRVYLKMPYAWCRKRQDSNITDRWNIWYYATSSANISDSNTSYSYVILSGQNDSVPLYRSLGIAIRPFKNIPVVPDNSWTKLKAWTWSAGIYWNSSLWLISISSDGINWITISDKNLWATTVYNNWDTLSEANCGKYYQRWNNYWFPFTWSVTLSSSQVNAGSYWPWNYYNSSTFIVRASDTAPKAWDSSWNNNLRWWVDWNVPV